MNTFIRVVEVWVPDREHSLLELDKGLYGSARHLAAGSRDICFGRGEGLPGRAWEQGRPIVLKQLVGSFFRRGAAAAADGLTCGIAMPIFADDRLTSVLVLFCGDDERHAGAIELWCNNPSKSTDMTLDDGYYGNTAEIFEFISRQTAFRSGTGLPGLAWESGLPVFMSDLRKGTRFMRSDSATQVGINRGFALPCSSRDDHHWVMAFLSALATPITRRFETWLADADGRFLQRQGGFCEKFGVIAPGDANERVGRGEGALGRALSAGMPSLVSRASFEPGSAGTVARATGNETLVTVPVMRAGRVAAVIAWYF
jgi:hypothetical protein